LPAVDILIGCAGGRDADGIAGGGTLRGLPAVNIAAYRASTDADGVVGDGAAGAETAYDIGSA
jgi:hypothetical protein